MHTPVGTLNALISQSPESPIFKLPRGFPNCSDLGKNLKGLILGFGAYVGISVMILALLPALGSRFEILSERLRSGSYLFALLVWTVALWSYAPNPPARRSRGSGPDYDQFAGETREKLEGLRDYFGDPKRP